MRAYELELPIKLNQAQIAGRARVLAKMALRAIGVEGEIEEARDEARTRIKALKEDLTGIRTEVRDLARAIRRGEEPGEVKVEARVAEDNSKVDVVRMDTGEVVETRALTEDDRQMQIDDVLARVEEESKAVERESTVPDELEDEDDGYEGDGGLGV